MVDPLEKLLVNREELDREMLATALAGLVHIDKNNGEIVLTRKTTQFPKKMQLLVYLASRKAAKALNLVEKEETSSSAIQIALGMSGGTVRGQLSMLVKDRLVKNNKGDYFLPNYSVDQVRALIEQYQKE